MVSKMTVEFDAPTGMTPAEVVEQIAMEMMSDGESGTIADGPDGGRLEWRFEEDGPGVDIDRRQRVAAAALMMGFDLPQPAEKACRSMLAAARLCPGMTTGDMAPMDSQGRKAALELAQGLITEMLAEINGASRPEDETRVLRMFRLPVEHDEMLRRIASRDNDTVGGVVVKAVRALIAEEMGK